jgi:hypothetical protein
VLVVSGVGHREAHFVQPARPQQQLPRTLVLELPLACAGLEQRERGALHARRVLEVDVVAFGHAHDRVIAHVLVPDAAEQIVQHAFAHRSV